MPTVHLRVNDAATNEPTPVRLRVTGPGDAYFVPLGQQADFPIGRGENVGGQVRLGRERWSYSPGGSEIVLPAGVPLRVQAMKGPCYRPLDETVSLKPGQMTLRLAISRVTALPDGGWFAGDGHTEFLTPHAAKLEAEAEGLRLVNLLALDFPAAALDGQTYHTTPNLEAFSGQSLALEGVAVNTLNVHPVLGRLALLYAHRPVHPLTFGGPDAGDDWSVSDWCDQCRRKGGYPVWVDPFETVSGVVWGEAFVALLNGKLAAIELDGQGRKQPLLPAWYRLLNAGFQVQLVGASGKDTNRTPVGGMRTYAAAPPGEDFSHAGWIDGVRAGRSFVTNGPLVSLTRDGPTLVARAESVTPIDTLDIVADGLPVASARATAHDDGVWRATVAVRPEVPAIWFAARVAGGKAMLNPGQPAFAHTAPAFADDPPPLRRSAKDLAPFRKAVETTIHWVESAGRFAEAKSREKLLASAREALDRIA